MRALPPRRIGPFVGRRRELAQLVSWLEEGEGALLTVVGPPGVGKSRLLAQASADAAGLEVTWVDVQTARGAVAARIAETIGAARHDEAALARALGDTDVLVLDGIDDAVAEVAVLAGRLVDRSRHLRIVLTSRRTLDDPREEVLFVEGLERPASNARLEDAASGELLLATLARAGRSQPLTEIETAAARTLLERVGGLPLAIELVAAQVAELGADALASSHTRPLDWVVRGDGNPLEQALAASARDLPPDARALLSELALLDRPFDGADAALLCDGESALRLLRRLRTSSWLVHEETPDGPRYDLLPPVRQFVREQLTAPSAALPTRVAHAVIVGLPRGRLSPLDVVAAAFAADANVPPETMQAALRAAFHPFASASRGDAYADIARSLAARGRIAPEVAALTLARGSIDVGRFDEAREALATAARSSDARVREEEEILRARLHFRTGDFERLARLAATLTPTGPDDVEVLTTAARIRGEHALARAIYERARARAVSPLDRAVLHALEARHLVEGGEHEPALTHLRSALAEAPDDARVRASCATTHAMALHDGAQPVAALPHYEHGTRAYMRLGSPLGAYVRGAHALAALEAGRHDEACATFLALLDDAPPQMTQLLPLVELARWMVHGTRADDAASAPADDAVVESSRALVRAFIARSEGRSEASRLEAALADNAPHARWSVVSRALSRLARDAPVVKRAAQVQHTVVLLDRAATWFAVTGSARVSLASRPTLGRVLERLARASDRGEPPLSVDDIADAAWPGERIVPRAKKTRVQVAISTLRKLGLAAAVGHGPAGYRLTLPVVWADAAPR